MLAESSIIGFVAVTDLDRARAFYANVLGLDLLADDGFALVFGSGSHTIRVVAVDDLSPQPFTVLGWAIPDAELDSFVDRLIDAEITFLRYGHFEQDERGVWTAPNCDRVAWFSDPDGNVLSLSSNHERETTRKKQ